MLSMKNLIDKYKDMHICNKVAFFLSLIGCVGGTTGAIGTFANFADLMIDYNENEPFYDGVMSSEEYTQFINDLTDEYFADYKAGNITYEEFNNQVAELKTTYKISEYIANCSNEVWKTENAIIEEHKDETTERLAKSLFVSVAGMGTVAAASLAASVGDFVEKFCGHHSHNSRTQGR